MNGWKSYLTSKTLWGIVAMVIIAIGGLLGYDLSDLDKVELEKTLSALGVAVAGAWAFFGRVFAKKRLGSGGVEINRDTGLPK